MKIKVTYFGPIADFAGRDEEEIEIEEGRVVTVVDLLKMLSIRHGQEFSEAINGPRCLITVSGSMEYHTEKLNTKLKDGDHVFITTLVAGG
jgi:MoaD family protein